MSLKNGQEKVQSPKVPHDWSDWFLIVLMAAALCGFAALAVYLFY